MKNIIIKDDEQAVFVINGKEVYVSKLTVTPSGAEEILSNSKEIGFKNRNPLPQRYKLYSEDMRNGSWKTNGETIKFDKEGALIDGSNRLNAVSIGNKTIDFLSVGNLDRDCVDTIDDGIKRSLEHVLNMQGYAYETGAAAIVRLKMQLDKQRLAQGQSAGNLGIKRTDEVMEFENHKEVYNKVTQYAKDVYTNSFKALNRPEVGAIYLHLTDTLKVDKGIVEEFFDKLISHTPKTIFFKTYESLMNKKSCRGADRMREYIRCWNSFVRGNRVNRCAYNEGDWFIEPPKED